MAALLVIARPRLPDPLPSLVRITVVFELPRQKPPQKDLIGRKLTFWNLLKPTVIDLVLCQIPDLTARLARVTQQLVEIAFADFRLQSQQLTDTEFRLLPLKLRICCESSRITDRTTHSSTVAENSNNRRLGLPIKPKPSLLHQHLKHLPHLHTFRQLRIMSNLPLAVGVQLVGPHGRRLLDSLGQVIVDHRR